MDMNGTLSVTLMKDADHMMDMSSLCHSAKVISILKDMFAEKDVLESETSDGGLQFSSTLCRICQYLEGQPCYITSQAPCQ